MRVALATKDEENINEHFGRAKKFAIYNFENGFGVFESIREVPEENSSEGNESDKIDRIISTISDASIMYCADIGAFAAARVVREKIHPMKVSEETPIETEIQRLNQLMEKPPLWIRKILVKSAGKKI